MTKDKARKTFYGCVRVAQPPDSVFESIRAVAKLDQWSWFRNIRRIEANLYQAEDPDGTCRFFWIEDAERRRVILQQTQHTDSPCWVISVSGNGSASQVESQYSSFLISPAQRRHLIGQLSAIQKLLEQTSLASAS